MTELPSLRRGRDRHALAMNDAGINRGKSGNVSARLRDAVRRLPGHAERAAVRETDAARHRRDVARRRGARAARCRRRSGASIATSIAQRADAHAIVHTHAPFATSLACLRRGIPAFHYMVAVAGGADIRCAPYATFGTQALSDHALAALAGRTACLLANHGMIAIGASLASALALAVEVETLAEMYWRALQIGEPDAARPTRRWTWCSRSSRPTVSQRELRTTAPVPRERVHALLGAVRRGVERRSPASGEFRTARSPR